MMNYFHTVRFVLTLLLFLSPVAHASTPECDDFEQYAIHQIVGKEKDPDPVPMKDATHPIVENTQGFNTDGLVVMKDGKVVYEFYDGDPQHGGTVGGLYQQDTVHSLWSASKTISATLVGREIYAKTFSSANEISLTTPLDKVLAQPAPVSLGANANAHFYSDVQIENLLAMSSNFKWDENYESGIKESTFLPMLYFKKGRADMLSYALSQPMQTEGPGNRWNYSGGNAIILFGMLQKIYAQENRAADYDHFPWTTLFNPLEMKGVVFERDDKGVFIGNSYVYMRPLDMAALGQLYLDRGMYKGQRLIDESWINEAQEISPAALNHLTPVSYLHEEGVYSRRGFWLNQQIKQDDGSLYGPEFPDSPKDMYFAAGHYGQLIIVLPTQHLVIARTGHDSEYWTRLNRFVSKTVQCFAKGGN